MREEKPDLFHHLLCGLVITECENCIIQTKMRHFSLLFLHCGYCDFMYYFLNNGLCISNKGHLRWIIEQLFIFGWRWSSTQSFNDLLSNAVLRQTKIREIRHVLIYIFLSVGVVISKWAFHASLPKASLFSISPLSENGTHLFGFQKQTNLQ